jgi:hypothetical protein
MRAAATDSLCLGLMGKLAHEHPALTGEVNHV